MHLIFAAATLFISATTAHAFDKIIAYADSYTDNGNDFRGSKFPPTPYYEGRFSNGRTWLEEVAIQLKDVPIVNNGHGGATTNNNQVKSVFNGWTVPSLLDQIDTIPVNGTEKDLYIIYIGYNDLNGILNPNQYTVVRNYTYKNVADNVVNGIEKIKEKYNGKEFLLMPVPPFDRFPVIKDSDKPRAKKLINRYNQLMIEKVKAIGDINVNIMDDHAWFETALDHPELFGLRTDNGPCIPGIGNTNECSDSDAHFYWDSYHPSAKVHRNLGYWATEQLKSLYPDEFNAY
ncbi:hypothetical protein K493DRAFT_304612 [Basidiobolus meristosporus CBS 931.73]|uniref:SGNH hydrolase n=1 Tax=Basidiobolus meristosporus CBS 931.73 TaxID=1314790 RepID=A0A1Y1XYI3_9FUNG|nr:hypothetical protein K493DRAFT_304612 [Basidiobolus meristosporus CBS 931.73]|eukprot:ORX90801.1 hypothetical protein K493DRAFT_304612 [Basidiobolus meristosporus CBS 931.73]